MENENAQLNEKKWDSEANTYDERYFYIRSMQEKIVSLLNLNIFFIVTI